jgi:hypothetical protein
LTISADLKILKQPNHVKHLRIFSTIFEILKTLPLKGVGEWESGGVGEWESGRVGEWESGRITPSPLHPLTPSLQTTNH